MGCGDCPDCRLRAPLPTLHRHQLEAGAFRADDTGRRPIAKDSSKLRAVAARAGRYVTGQHEQDVFRGTVGDPLGGNLDSRGKSRTVLRS